LMWARKRYFKTYTSGGREEGRNSPGLTKKKKPCMGKGQKEEVDLNPWIMNVNIYVARQTMWGEKSGGRAVTKVRVTEGPSRRKEILVGKKEQKEKSKKKKKGGSQRLCRL